MQITDFYLLIYICKKKLYVGENYVTSQKGWVSYGYTMLKRVVYNCWII